MLVARRSSAVFSTDPTARSVRSAISATAWPGAGAAPAAARGTGLDLVHLYPAVYAPQPRPSSAVRYAAALSGALSAAAGVVVAAAAVFHR